MGEIDNVLQQIENKYQQKQVNSNRLKQSKTPENKHDIDAFLSEIESQSHIKNSQGIKNDLVSQIESNFTQQKSQTKSNSDNLFSDIEKQYQGKKNNISSSQKSNLAENYITDIVTNYHEKQKAIISEKKSHNLEEIRQQELEKQREEKLITNKAEVWLKKLDPYSDEGFWFEQFALSYPSKLEAAIDYLKALGFSNNGSSAVSM